MEERRKLKRKYLFYFTRVFDRETGELLGHLANLTAGGMMLISDTPIPLNRDYRLHMELSKELFIKAHLDFEARCIWCRPEDFTPQFFNAGFQFITITPEDTEVIEQIVQEYGIRD